MSLHRANNHIVVAADGGSPRGRMIERILRRDGYDRVSVADTGAEAIALCSHRSVDLLLLDLRLPDLDGLVVLEQLTPIMREGRLQIIVISERDDVRARYRALALGVRDFITEPIDPDEVRLRARNAMITSTLEGELIAKNAQLLELIDARSNELGHARQEVLRHLAIAAEFRDDDTGEHTDRVGRTSGLIGEAYGLDPEAVQMLAAAAPLHDVGKIGLPDRIVLKRGKLTAPEREIMQTHAQIGAAILAGSDVAELRLAETIALHHHERWDGSGYPFGLVGDAIPLAARIVAVADVFDALAFARQYKSAWPLPEAVAEIDGQRGHQFDPQLVDAFLRLDHETLVAPIHPEKVAARQRELSAAAAGANGAHVTGPTSRAPLFAGAGR
jgi:putative two-component system response regulator